MNGAATVDGAPVGPAFLVWIWAPARQQCPSPAITARCAMSVTRAARSLATPATPSAGLGSTAWPAWCAPALLTAPVGVKPQGRPAASLAAPTPVVPGCSARTPCQDSAARRRAARATSFPTVVQGTHAAVLAGGRVRWPVPRLTVTMAIPARPTPVTPRHANTPRSTVTMAIPARPTPVTPGHANTPRSTATTAIPARTTAAYREPANTHRNVRSDKRAQAESAPALALQASTGPAVAASRMRVGTTTARVPSGTAAGVPLPVLAVQ